ncbi:MAG TPA: Gfo/Idh/MocA family oxidoreductase [Phycisphaerae bacterium]|nr:Gfo/Idh/MocA family oxidoreductase [Phycisphaerae bacterium]
MGISIGICGTGSFAGSFIPLFKSHPLVERVVLCDLDAAKLKAAADKHGIDRTCPSLDALCQEDVDAIAIFTQHHIHGPQAAQALKAGKHVYSAVPAAASVEEAKAIVQAARQTGRIYMTGETSTYTPAALYCRRRVQHGDFGHVVYGEGDYMHDMDHGLYDVLKWRLGEDWQRYANWPPMYYPTHSVSMIVSVTGARVTHVSAMGFEDRHADGLFRRDDSIYDNRFSNETMLARMSDGSMSRFNEFRRIGTPCREGMRLYGTEGAYEDQFSGRRWLTKDGKVFEDLTDLLACRDRARASDGAVFKGVSAVHDLERLPAEFAGLSSGHAGSHHYLVDDFVKACAGVAPLPMNVAVQAARYLLPGLIAHESALAGGKLMEVPDFGDAP